jgi:aminopeptidase N
LVKISIVIKRLTLLFAFSALIVSYSQATSLDSAVSTLTDVDGRYREHNCDFTNISLDVRFEPKEGRVIGKEMLLFSPIQPDIDSVYLDAPGIMIKKLLVDKQAVKYDTTPEGLIIRFAKKLKWEEKHSIYIEYEATPHKGLYFIGWNDEKNLSRKQVWTQGQGIDNRNWFPCYDDVDDKVITETTITFDAAYTVVSNGTLVDSKLNPDGTKTWHYAMSKPMAPYLVMIGIDKYKWKDYKSNNGITSREYYYDNMPQVEAPTYQYSKEVMDWLATEIGVPYQWPGYANVPVQDFMFGAMENTSATVYGDFYMQDARGNIDRPYLGVNAHELTHQWFGDYITEYSGTHHWLHESFATYYSKIFLRHLFGEDQYEWAKHGEAASSIQVDKENRYPIAHTKAGSARHYPKGSFVIGMLRYVVGDEVYRKTIQYYLHKHAFGNVDTHDFYQAFQDKCGINLDWFFNEWIYHSGVPAYDVSYDARGGRTVFYVKQTHITDSLTHLFRMPIVFEVDYTDNTKDTVRTVISEKNDTVYVPNKSGKQVAYTLFDPGYNVLKTVHEAKSYKEWLTQANNAHNMIDRYDAVHALRDTAIDKKRDDLIAIFNKEKYYAIRSEVVYQLRKDGENEYTLALLRKATKDANFNVRRSVIDHVDTIPQSLLPDYEALLNDSSYITIENAFRKLVKQDPQHKDKYFSDVKSTLGMFKNVRIAMLEFKATDDDASLNELIDYTSHSYEFMTRTRAMAALERVYTGVVSGDATKDIGSRAQNEVLIKNLIDAILNPNSRLANPAIKALKKLMEKEGFQQQALVYYEAGPWKDWQQATLKKVFEKSSK